jgi:hypothetical protein
MKVAAEGQAGHGEVEEALMLARVRRGGLK